MSSITKTEVRDKQSSQEDALATRLVAPLLPPHPATEHTLLPIPQRTSLSLGKQLLVFHAPPLLSSIRVSTHHICCLMRISIQQPSTRIREQ